MTATAKTTGFQAPYLDSPAGSYPGGWSLSSQRIMPPAGVYEMVVQWSGANAMTLRGSIPANSSWINEDHGPETRRIVTIPSGAQLWLQGFIESSDVDTGAQVRFLFIPFTSLV